MSKNLIDTAGTVVVLLYGLYAVVRRKTVGENWLERQKNKNKASGETNKATHGVNTYSFFAGIGGVILIVWALLRLWKLQSA